MPMPYATARLALFAASVELLLSMRLPMMLVPEFGPSFSPCSEFGTMPARFFWNVEFTIVTPVEFVPE